MYKKILTLNYKIPNSLTSLAKDIIQGLLTSNAKRYGLTEIRAHDFYKLYKEKKSSGILIGKQKIPIDENILNEVGSHGFDKEFTRQCL